MTLDLDRVGASADTNPVLEREEAARALLQRLFALCKLARLYDVTNDAFPDAYAALLEALERFGGVASVHLLGDGTFVNQVLLDRDPALIERGQFLYATFQPLGVTQILLGSGTTADNVRDLIVSLQEAGRARDANGKPPPRDGAHFGHIHLRRAPQEQTREAAERVENERTVHAFAVARVVMVEFLEQIGRGHQPSLAAPKRILHDLVAAASTHLSTLLALASDPARGDDAVDHLLGTALVVLGVGHRLGLPRPVIHRLSLAALLHDIAPHAGEVGEEPRQHALKSVQLLARCRHRSLEAIERVVIAHEHSALAVGRRLGHSAGPASALVAVAHTFDTLQRRGDGRPGMPPAEAMRALACAFAGPAIAPLVAMVADALGDHPPGSVVETTIGPAVVTSAPGPGVPPSRPSLRLIAGLGSDNPGPSALCDLSTPQMREVAILRELDAGELGLGPAAILLSQLPSRR